MENKEENNNVLDDLSLSHENGINDNHFYFNKKNNIGTQALEIFYNYINKYNQINTNNYNNKNIIHKKKHSNRYQFYDIIRNIYLQLNSGVSIHDVSLPIFICEPRSMLEKISDFMCYPQFIIRFINIYIYSIQ